jgi:hypothetical protein
MRWVSSGSWAAIALIAICAGARAKSQPAASLANYRDIAAAAGITAPTIVGEADSKDYILETTGGGVAVLDYDGDGRLDIFVVNGARRGPDTSAPASHLYRNAGDGTFTDVTAKAGLTARGWGQNVCAGDIDNDGHVDLFVTYYGRLVLYRNNGDGTFTDITGRSGLPADRQRWNTGAAFLDADRDGHLDLFVSAYVAYEDALRHPPGSRPDCMWKGRPVMCGPQGLAGSHNAFFRGRGDGTFVDVSEKAGLLKVKPAFGFTPLVLDYDNDGWSDVYVANDSSASLLFRNDRAGGFTEVGLRAGVALTADGRAQAGMGAAAADYDGDGWLDIVKTNFDDDTTSVYRNLGDGTFEDATLAAGLGANTRFLGWGIGFLDVDRDGWPDLFAVNGHVYPQADQVGGRYSYRQPKVFYRNGGAGRFVDVSARTGPGIAAATASRGAAIGDLFGTGRQDIVVNNMHAAPSLLHDCGNTPSGRHAIAIRLIGTRSNRSALGARVTVVSGGRRLVDEVRSGGSFGSQHALALSFGLGARTQADRIEVAWLGGAREVIGATAADRLVVIREGAGVVQEVPFVARPVPGCAAS